MRDGHQFGDALLDDDRGKGVTGRDGCGGAGRAVAEEHLSAYAAHFYAFLIGHYDDEAGLCLFRQGGIVWFHDWHFFLLLIISLRFRVAN